MNILTDSIELLATLDGRPDDSEIPPSQWDSKVTFGRLLDPAFDFAEKPEEAETYFRHLIIHWLIFGKNRNPKAITPRLTVRDAIAQIRAALWWFALSKDVGSGELYSMQYVNGRNTRVERATYRDIAYNLFGAANPVKQAEEAALLERVHNKREREAKRRGEVYWKHNHAENAGTQAKLF